MNESQLGQQQIHPYQAYPMPTDFLSKEEVDLLKRTLLKTFAEDEQMTFVRICQRTRLDPFTKQLYATRRYQKIRDEGSGETRKVPTLVPVTGIMGLCAVAERTGHYDGCEIYWSGPEGNWQNEWLAEDYPAAAKAVVYHKGRTHPEVAIARWNSYVGQTYNYQTKTWEVSDFWNKMPDYMLGKVAKAAALRGAFPDQLSNVYIREELDSDITDSEETESIPTDESKIAENQRRDDLTKQHPPPGVTIVAQSGGSRPTPAEALEPAFPEDKLPQKSKAPPPPTAQAAVASPPLPTERKTDPYVKEPPDDLDMSTPKPQAPAEPAPDLSWKEHVITSVDHAKFKGHKVGEFTQRELMVIDAQWLPPVLEQWDDATEAQQADAIAFQKAIAFSKQQKPW